MAGHLRGHDHAAHGAVHRAVRDEHRRPEEVQRAQVRARRRLRPVDLGPRRLELDPRRARHVRRRADQPHAGRGHPGDRRAQGAARSPTAHAGSRTSSSTTRPRPRPTGSRRSRRGSSRALRAARPRRTTSADSIDGRGLTVSLVSRHVVFQANLATLTPRGRLHRRHDRAGAARASTDEPARSRATPTRRPARRSTSPATGTSRRPARSRCCATSTSSAASPPSGCPRSASATSSPLVDPGKPGSQELNKRVDIVVLSGARRGEPRAARPGGRRDRAPAAPATGDTTTQTDDRAAHDADTDDSPEEEPHDDHDDARHRKRQAAARGDREEGRRQKKLLIILLVVLARRSAARRTGSCSSRPSPKAAPKPGEVVTPRADPGEPGGRPLPQDRHRAAAHRRGARRSTAARRSTRRSSSSAAARWTQLTRPDDRAKLKNELEKELEQRLRRGGHGCVLHRLRHPVTAPVRVRRPGRWEAPRPSTVPACLGAKVKVSPQECPVTADTRLVTDLLRAPVAGRPRRVVRAPWSRSPTTSGGRSSCRASTRGRCRSVSTASPARPRPCFTSSLRTVCSVTLVSIEQRSYAEYVDVARRLDVHDAVLRRPDARRRDPRDARAGHDGLHRPHARRPGQRDPAEPAADRDRGHGRPRVRRAAARRAALLPRGHRRARAGHHRRRVQPPVRPGRRRRRRHGHRDLRPQARPRPTTG